MTTSRAYQDERAITRAPVAFLATFLLVFTSIYRPQEIWPQLDALHLLDVLTGVAALGIAFDFATGKERHAYSPQLPFLFGFLLSSYASSALFVGARGLEIATNRSLIAAVLMLIVMYGARTRARLQALVGLLAVLGVFVAAVAVDQGLREPSCIELPNGDRPLHPNGLGYPDGRPCETRIDCEEYGVPDVEYACERVGAFHTVSVEGRVRWRGQLGDPNELSVFLGSIVPLLLASTLVGGRWLQGLLKLGLLAACMYAVILTRSRGGVLVLGTVLSAYFVARYRLKGLVGALLFAAPVLLLGGREGLKADASADERRGILFDSMSSFVRNPLLGRGIDMFTSDHGLTSHNAYVLAAVDLGFVGLYFWTGLLWVSLKIALTVARRPPAMLPKDVQQLAFAIVISFLGTAAGIFFLSFTYKQLLFIWLGIAGALYAVVRQYEPSFEVRLRPRDWLGIAAFDVALIAVVFVYTRLRPA